jgi:hypothetical protein
VKETAEVMKLSTDTITRDWKLAKVWLLRDLRLGAGKPKLAIDSDAFRNIVADLAWQKAGLIINLAKSKMLNDFGESDAADAILKSIFSEANRGQTTFGTK